MISFALDAVTSFSFFPLQIMIYLSLILAVLSIGVGIVITALRLTQGDEFFGGQATHYCLVTLVECLPIVLYVYHRAVCSTDI